MFKGISLLCYSKRKIEDTKVFVSSQEKTVGDTLSAFESKFEHIISTAKQSFKDKLD